MKPIPEMTDQELAEFVAVEFLGDIKWMYSLFTPFGLEAIEDEFRKRSKDKTHSAVYTMAFCYIGYDDEFTAHLIVSDGVNSIPHTAKNKNRYRALLEAVAMAVKDVSQSDPGATQDG